MSIDDKTVILNYLDDIEGSADSAAICETTGLPKAKVQNTLSALFREGQVQRVGRGFYASVLPEPDFADTSGEYVEEVADYAVSVAESLGDEESEALEVQTLAEFLATCFGLDASRVHVATEFYWAFVAPPEEA